MKSLIKKLLREGLNGDYVYHGTGKGQALNIQKAGSMTLNNTGEASPSISFTGIFNYAKYYANAKGGSSKMVILRTKLDNRFKLSDKIRDNKKYEYVALEPILSNTLEILTQNMEWQPLNNWNVIFDEPLTNINENADLNKLSGTKIVDGNGQPMVVYRAQEDNRKQGVERQSKHMGIYFSADKDSTKIYGNIIKPFYLNIKNPIALKDKEWNLSVIPEYYYNYLVSKGFDGAIWLRNGIMYEIVAFYPEQIISI